MIRLGFGTIFVLFALAEPLLASSSVTLDEYRAAGDRFRHLGKPLQALTNYEKALKANPKDLHCIYYVALTRLQLGEYDLAVSDMERAQKLLDDKVSPLIQTNFAMLQLRARYLRYIAGSRTSHLYLKGTKKRASEVDPDVKYLRVNLDKTIDRITQWLRDPQFKNSKALRYERARLALIATAILSLPQFVESYHIPKLNNEDEKVLQAIAAARAFYKQRSRIELAIDASYREDLARIFLSQIIQSTGKTLQGLLISADGVKTDSANFPKGYNDEVAVIDELLRDTSSDVRRLTGLKLEFEHATLAHRQIAIDLNPKILSEYQELVNPERGLSRIDWFERLN